MKKILSLMLIFASFTLLTSCSQKENENEIAQNPLEGTLWSLEDETFYGEKYINYIEFIDSKNVSFWHTNVGSKYNGTYSIDGNKVKFYNLKDEYYDYTFKEGTFTSRSLTVYFQYKNNSSIYSDTYVKE